MLNEILDLLIIPKLFWLIYKWLASLQHTKHYWPKFWWTSGV